MSTAYLLALIVGSALFWLLRIYYWSITVEIPFSDMAAYLQMGRGVYEQWDFVWNDFWWTFKPPGQPLLIAASWLVAGGESLRAWQYLQTLLTFLGLIWLVREVRLLTGQRWLAVALLWVVALSKPSVFWSLKYAQETLGEAVIYSCLAGGLWALRHQSIGRFAALGALYGFALLCRPQCALYVAVFPLTVVGQAVACQGWRGVTDRRRRQAIAAFACGVLVLWTPWVVRSFVLYDAFLPLTTQGPYAVLWELDSTPVDVPGYGPVAPAVWPILREAPTRFRNDYEASRYASAVAWAWIKANRWQLPQIVATRIKRSILDNDASGLTRVSRTQLLPGWWNMMLLDKDRTGWVAVAGICGLLLCSIKWGFSGALIPAIVLLPWLATVSMMGWARYFEPSLPLVLFGNTVLISTLISSVRWQLRPDRDRGSQSVTESPNRSIHDSAVTRISLWVTLVAVRVRRWPT
jgi:hypothetical protein